MGRLIKLVVVLMLFSGCAAKSPYKMGLNLNGKFSEDYAVDLVRATYRAYNKIKACKHPDVMEEVKKWEWWEANADEGLNKLEIIVAKKPGDFCAYVERWGRLNDNRIFVTPDEELFYNGRCKFEESMGHEMLHLLGFMHDTEEEKSHFEELMYRCGLK